MSDKAPRSIFGPLIAVAVAFAAPGSVRQATAQESGPALMPLSIPQTYQDRTIKLGAWLATPSTSGPFATVILAHGCNGVNRDVKGNAWPNMNKWAEWLNQQGYAALILDSYTARGIKTICRDQGVDTARELGKLIPADVRALDIFKAADVLAKLPQINPREFGAIGFSHGGASVLRAAAEDNSAAMEGKAALAADHGKLAAFVGMYPGCWESVRSTFIAPVLILIGTADRRTSSGVCQLLADHTRTAGSPVTIKVYPGATHSFDVERPDQLTKFGDTLRFSADASADAHSRIKDFLGRYLTAR